MGLLNDPSYPGSSNYSGKSVVGGVDVTALVNQRKMESEKRRLAEIERRKKLSPLGHGVGVEEGATAKVGGVDVTALVKMRKEIQAAKQREALQKKLLEEEKANTKKREDEALAKSYDLQRQKVQAGGEEERAGLREAIATENASKGFGVGSGMLEKQQQLADIEQRKRQAGQMTDIAIAQAEREDVNRQRGLDREQAKEFFTKDLSFREKQLAENVRQFNTSDAFRKYALERGYDEDEIERVWKAGQNIYDWEQRNEFQTSQNDWAENQRLGYTDSKGVYHAGTQDFSKELLEYQDELETGSEERKLKFEAAYYAGKAGQPIDSNWSEAEKAAYNAGKSGKTVLEAERDYDLQSKFLSTAILYGLENGLSSDAMNTLGDLYKGWFGEYPSWFTGRNPTPGTYTNTTSTGETKTTVTTEGGVSATSTGDSPIQGFATSMAANAMQEILNLSAEELKARGVSESSPWFKWSVLYNAYQDNKQGAESYEEWLQRSYPELKTKLPQNTGESTSDYAIRVYDQLFGGGQT